MSTKALAVNKWCYKFIPISTRSSRQDHMTLIRDFSLWNKPIINQLYNSTDCAVQPKFKAILSVYHVSSLIHHRYNRFQLFTDFIVMCTDWSYKFKWSGDIEGVLPKGPYLPCVSMAGRALLAGYYRYMSCIQWLTSHSHRSFGLLNINRRLAGCHSDSLHDFSEDKEVTMITCF